MEDAVPVIYARGGEVRSLTPAGRLAALAIALVMLTPLVTASLLTPSPDGTGSHTKLGLAPCPFMATTGIPCPSCGMTTSWTWFARGNLRASFYVQPMGTVLAILCVCCFWTALYAGITGRPVFRLVQVIPGRYYFVPLLSFAILAWAWKIYIHVTGHDGWHY